MTINATHTVYRTGALALLVVLTLRSRILKVKKILDRVLCSGRGYAFWPNFYVYFGGGYGFGSLTRLEVPPW